MSNRKYILGGLLASLIVALPHTSAAQEFPNRPVNLLVGFGAGSSTDAMARYYGQHVAEILGQPIVVDNRPGASQFVAINAVVTANPDGYTLMIITGSAASQGPGLRDDLPYESMEDFVPVALVATAPGIFVTAPDFPVDDLAEFIAYAQDNPGELNYASSGVGSAGHLSAELLKSLIGIDIAHIPYDGTSQLMTAIVRNESQFGIGTIAAALPLLQGDMVRALAVTGDTRSELLPDVPALSEVEIDADLSALDPYTYYMIIAPKDTPQPVIEQINAAFNEVSARPEAIEAMAVLGFDTAVQTPEEARAFVMDDIQVWREFKDRTGFEWGN